MGSDFEDGVVEDSAFEDSAFEDSAFDDSAFDDTVARPARARDRIVELDAGDGDTIPVKPALREPPTPLPAPSPSPSPSPSSPVDVSDNVWSVPLPEKPAPFRVRLDDGTLLSLDQPVYLGRKPSVPRIHPGGTPLLVTLSSPERQVSSTHLELSTSGGAIVATDLKSTNGSLLHLPGGEVRALVSGATAVVTPGTKIELGDGNTIELLPPADPAAAPADQTGASS